MYKRQVDTNRPTLAIKDRCFKVLPIYKYLKYQYFCDNIFHFIITFGNVRFYTHILIKLTEIIVGEQYHITIIVYNDNDVSE